MVQNTKVCGKKTKLTEKANSHTLTMIHTKVNGKMIRQTAMVYSSITKQMHATKDIGKMT